MTINMTKTPMVDLKKAAQASLAKHGVEADGKGSVKVRLVLDHSGSMRTWYQAGAVQRLTEQTLGLASALDDDGTIETWYFGSGVSKMYGVSLNPVTPSDIETNPKRKGWFRSLRTDGAVSLDPYYVGWVDRSHILEPWGSTNYPAGLMAPIEFQRTSGEEEPALVIFQTDGGPDSQVLAKETLQRISGDKTFIAFVVFGEEKFSDGRFTVVGDFMHSLDELRGRTRDNASAFFTGGLSEYASLPDSEVYDGVLGEFVRNWLPQVL